MRVGTRPLVLGGLALGGLGLAWSRGDLPRFAPVQADLTGKVAVVTGANSGIGKETALALGAMGATVVMACRSTQRGEAAAEELRHRHVGIDVTVLALDLSDLDSVRAFARAVLGRFDRLDILVNNAGRVVGERQRTVQGFEASIGTNHLGPFLLTDLLLPRLIGTGREHGPARIVNVASSTHRQGELELDDLMWERRTYAPLKVYAASKLANVLFTLELARRTDPGEVTVNALHPGNITTGFGVSPDAPRWMQILFPYSKYVFLTPERGADTQIWLAASDEAEGEHGGYFSRRHRWQPSAAARDAALARGLWERSAQLVAAGTG